MGESNRQKTCAAEIMIVQLADGRKFDGFKRASLATGISVGALKWRLEQGKYPFSDEMPRLMRRPVKTADGKEFKSVLECGRYYGLSGATAWGRWRGKTYPFGPQPGENCRKIVWRGIEFAKQRDLADYLGVCEATVSKYRMMGKIDDLDKATPFRRCGWKGKKVAYAGKEIHSDRDRAEAR